MLKLQTRKRNIKVNKNIEKRISNFNKIINFYRFDNDVINDKIVDFVTMLNNNIKRIEEIKKLEYNWNDNEAEPIDKTICDNVLNIIYEVIIQPKIFPTANDSIQLEYYDKNDRNKYLEFEVFKDYINVYEILSDSKEKSYIINSISTNKINSIIMDFYEINRK